MKFLNLILLLILITGFPLYAKSSNFSSVYTSLTDCKLIESSSEGAGSSLQECPSREDYQVLIESGDARSWIVLKKGERTVVNLWNEVMDNARGNFAYVSGKVAEWRYKGKVPIAFIFRVAGTVEIVNDNNSPPLYKEKSILLVVRLKNEKACLIGTTTSNKKARKIADSNKMCP
jgi:hypothetical protein